MTKLVAGLERDHLVIRRADGGDHRGVIVHLTPHGRALVRRARARKIDWLARVLRECRTDDAQAAGQTAGRLDQAARTAVALITAQATDLYRPGRPRSDAHSP
jgi:DNA-binding MarR family transcriptional regulator